MGNGQQVRLQVISGGLRTRIITKFNA